MKGAVLPGAMLSLFQRAARPISRDKADTLLLLAACAVVLIPHAAHLPRWTALTCAALLLWRGWITFNGNRMPARWLLLPIASLAMLGVYWTNQTLLGREAGVTMLVLLLSLKLLEMRARRDLFVVVFLGFFLMLTNLFYSQSIGTALLMVGAVILMLTAQLSFQYAHAAPPLKRRLGLGAMIFALSVPLTLVLFVLFPRIQGPLWGLPQDAQTGHTGLSDRMAPGNISKLALSTAVAFRVKFADPSAVPPKAKLYWRGPVFGEYDGKSWTALRARSFPAAGVSVQARGAPVRYQVTMEANGQRSVLALDLPRLAPPLTDNPTRITSDLDIVARQPIVQRLRYDAISYTDYTLQADAAPERMRDWLALPPGHNPQAIALAARLRRQFGDDFELANAVLRHFREQNFRYTLEPPPLGKEAMDDFLFNTRAGFCEHYASAFAVLMRAAGIPARVVTGYQGGEINPVDGYMTIRQSDAHAWNEIWLKDKGWMRIDPTAAIAPNRIERNLDSVLPSGVLGGFAGLNPENHAWLTTLRALRLRWDAVNNAWNQWILDYSPARQKSLLESLGLDHADWRTLAILMLAFGAAITALTLLALLRNHTVHDPVEQLYAKLCRKLERRGFARAPHEGPRAFRLRLAHEGAALPPAMQAAAIRFLEMYEALRYGVPAARERNSQNRHPRHRRQDIVPYPKAAISQLNSFLAACK